MKRSLSDLAAKVLSDEAKTVAEVSEDARAQAIDAIAEAMRRRKRQRRRVRWGAIASLGVAASVALFVGIGHRARSPLAVRGPMASASFVRGAPAVVRRGERVALTEGTPIESGDRVVVEPGARTTVAFASGTYVLADENSDLLLAAPPPATTFVLATGSVRADVAKLTPSERFLIRTADAEVEVRGTSFEVARVAPDPQCAAGNTTRVKVREGTVAVRAAGIETLVHAGESWPSGCDGFHARATVAAIPAEAPPSVALTPPAPPSAALTPPAPPPNPRHGGGPSPASSSIASRRHDPPPSSDLAAQNDLFEKAIARKRAGDAGGAVAGFEELLARYPSSHLAQSARAERMKLLRGIDRTRARAAAADYLKRYPDGFARHDAEVIVAGDGVVD